MSSPLPGAASPAFRLTCVCVCVTQREPSGEAVSLCIHPVSSYSGVRGFFSPGIEQVTHTYTCMSPYRHVCMNGFTGGGSATQLKELQVMFQYLIGT